MQKQFHPTDCTQLWRVTDHIDGKDYSWPLLATPGDTNEGACYEVRLAVHVETKAQQVFVYQRIDAMAYWKDPSALRWLVRPTFLAQFAKKCPGMVPQYYVQWDQPAAKAAPDQAPLEAQKPAETCPDEDFVRYLCASSGMTDIPGMRVTWHLVCYHAMRWLLEQGKPLNLDFIKLYALPYRANWKSILHARYPQSLKALSTEPEHRKAVLDAIGLSESLYSADLIEVNPGDTFGWTIEAVPSAKLEQAIADTEAKCLQTANSPANYLYRWSRAITNQYDNIISIYESFVKKSAKPLGSVDDSLPKNLWSLSGRKSRGRVRPFVPPVPDAFFSTDDSQPNNAKDASPAPAEEKIPELPEVPEARLEIQLVRPHRSVAGQEPTKV